MQLKPTWQDTVIRIGIADHIMPEDTREIMLDCDVSRCGSRVTNRPAPTDTDKDFLVQVFGHFDHHIITGRLAEIGFVREGNNLYGDHNGIFQSWRRGDVNLIVAIDIEFVTKHKLATALCTRLNLPNKSDRIAVFQALLYGAEYRG